MPFKSEAQRKLMYAAASPGGVAGVSKAVAKEFIKSDKPGLLPEKEKKPKAHKSLYKE